MVVTNLRTRIRITTVMILAGVIALIPRDAKVRERGTDGLMRDTVLKQVPLKLGLDLQGGMYTWASSLTSRSESRPTRSCDIDLARTVLRKRIDEFGVTEPLIQKEGDDRIVVELAGISDPGRAKSIVQKSAFLEFRITDRSQALDKALPAMDRDMICNDKMSNMNRIEGSKV